MIVYHSGNMLDAPGIPVIPVNCVGVMGKGLAKQAADKWPWILSGYRWKCGTGNFGPGDIMWLADGQLTVCLFATKAHWCDSSKLSWIERGLEHLAKASWPAAIFNIPKLGCGLGGLDWKNVKPLVEKYLADAPGTFNVWE